MRFHNYSDKETADVVARDSGDQALMVENSKVRIHQDFSIAVIRKRKRLDNVKKKLRAKGVTYAQIYPALLKV